MGDSFEDIPIISNARRNGKKRAERMRNARARGRHTIDEWVALKNEFGSRCVRCGTDEYRVERDHIIPLYQAGSSDGIENIQPVCAPCNAQKGAENFNWVEYRRENGF